MKRVGVAALLLVLGCLVFGVGARWARVGPFSPSCSAEATRSALADSIEEQLGISEIYPAPSPSILDDDESREFWFGSWACEALTFMSDGQPLRGPPEIVYVGLYDSESDAELALGRQFDPERPLTREGDHRVQGCVGQECTVVVRRACAVVLLYWSESSLANQGDFLDIDPLVGRFDELKLDLGDSCSRRG